MSRVHNPLAPKLNQFQAISAEIKGWVREVMELPEDTPVTVAELACRDEGCPDIETVIGVLEPGTPVRTVRVHEPMKNVKRIHVVEAAGAAVEAKNP